MFDHQRSKRPANDRTQTTPALKPSNSKRSIRQGEDLTRIPAYTQVWGNQLPPGLRLPIQRQEAHEGKVLQGPGELPTQHKENSTGLPDVLKTGVESLSGIAMNDVRVYYNSSKPIELHALAYTQGTEIYVGPGQEKHLPHEAWHVVQQRQGRVKPTLQAKGVTINDNADLEREADMMGKAAIHENAGTARASLQTKAVLPHLVIYRVVANQAQPIQRRPIDSTLYSKFDPKKSEQVTKDLLEVAIREDGAIVMATESEGLLKDLIALKTDKMVGTEAAALEGSISELVGEIEKAKNRMIIAVGLAVKAYQTSVEKEIYSKYEENPKHKIGTAKAKAAARGEQVKDIDLSKFPTFVEIARESYTAIKDKSDRVKADVSVLKKESETKHAAEKEYDVNVKYLSENKAAITERAAKLKVPPSTTNFEQLYKEAAASAGQGKWIEARDKSRTYTDALKSLKKLSDQAQKELDKAEKAYKNNEILIKDQRSKLFHIADSFELLNYIDTATRKLVEEIRQLIKDASNGAQEKDWLTAMMISQKCLSELSTLEVQLTELQKIPDLSKKIYNVGGTNVKPFDVIAMIKKLREKFSADSADETENKLRAYCDAIGQHSKSVELVGVAIEKDNTTAELLTLTGEIALKEFLNKGKTAAEANIIQEANNRFLNLNYTNLEWLVVNNRVTVGSGTPFLMADLAYIYTSHREYILTGTDGVKPPSGHKPVIHVHWSTINVAFPKAHVVPDLTTHAGPNPVENDIPIADNPVKQAIIAAGCTP